MPWVRIHDGALSHPKITGLVDLRNPFVLWVWGLTHCQMHLTDGVIVRDSVPSFARKAARELVRRNLWEALEIGWKVHDFLSWNDSRDLVLERQNQAKERRAQWRLRMRLGRVPSASGTLNKQRDNGQPNLTKPNHKREELTCPHDPPCHAPGRTDCRRKSEIEAYKAQHTKGSR